MQTTIDQFKTYHSAISGKFNSLGPIDVTRDRVLRAVDRGLFARQMIELAQKTGETDAESLFDQLRAIYSQVESEIVGGLPHECRQPLIESIIAEVQA